MPVLPAARASSIDAVNQAFYDNLWSGARLIQPDRFNTWPLIEALSQNAGSRLEVGPGMRPRLPIHDTRFLDISQPALDALANRGGVVASGSATALPYGDASFDLVAALDIVEHVADDHAALAELARVARPEAAVLLSVPLRAAFWTSFDDVVGHYRRYEPEALTALLRQHGFDIARSARYGLKPKSSRLVRWGMAQLEKNPRRALWYYNRFFMPLGLRFQKPLRFHDGLQADDNMGEILLHCVKQA